MEYLSTSMIATVRLAECVLSTAQTCMHEPAKAYFGG
jgi:hypothetical protein